MERGKIGSYGLIVGIMVFLMIVVYSFGGGFTGYAVYTQTDNTEFDLGTYEDTSWDGSSIGLTEENLTGNYTSKIFNAGADATWNSFTATSSTPSAEILFAVDGVTDVWQSSDGITWSLTNDGYTSGDGNGATYMSKNSSGSLFILFNQDLWKSDDSGITWTKVNDDFNPSDSNSGLVMEIDGNDNIFIVDGSRETWKSADSGISFTSISDDFGGAQNAKGLTSDNSNNLYLVEGTADIWKSTNSGVDWSLIKDDFNGGITNDATDMFSNSSGDLFILHNQDLWQSTDSGVTWTLASDDFNGGPDSNSGVIMFIDSSDNIFIADGGEDIYKSTNSGISFIRLVENINGASGNIFGLSSLSSSTTLDYQVRNCSEADCSDGTWQTLDIANLDLNSQYFQYKVNFTSPSLSTSPELSEISIDYDLVDETNPEISFSSQTTSNGVHLADSILVGADLSDDSQIYSFINFNSSLVLFYKLDESSGDIIDYSGYGNDGTNNGAAYGVSGKFGNALSFDGSDDISVGSFDPPHEGTVSFWVNANDKDDRHRVFGFHDAYEILLLDDGSTYHVSNQLFAAGTSMLEGNTAISYNEWHHVICTYNYSSNFLGIYVDGVLDNSNSLANDDPSTGILSVGKRTGGDDPYSGVLDEVMIWNRILSTEEIYSLYNVSSYSLNFTNLDVGNYTFYSYVQDISGNENQTETRIINLIDNSVPTITLVLPQDGNTYGYNESLDLNFSVSDVDDNIDSCWYILNGGTHLAISSCLNTTIDVPEGENTLVVYVNDTNGEESNDSATFTVDVGAPTIVLSSPINLYLSSQDVTFVYTATDVDLDSCELWGDFIGVFELNQTEDFPSNGAENTFNLNLNDGKYKWNVRCVDDLLNSAFNGNKTFYVDTVDPSLSLTQPSGTKSSREGVGLSFSVSDISPVSCKYNVYRGESVEIANTSINCSAGTESFDVTVDANFLLNFYVNDSAGNNNSSNISFSVSTSTGDDGGDTGSSGGGGGGGVSSFVPTALNVGKISSLIADVGETKNIIVDVENLGLKFVEDCNVAGFGEYSEWIFSSETKGLAGGESFGFEIGLNVPEDILAGVYNVSIEIACGDIIEQTFFDVEILEKQIGFELSKVDRISDEEIKVIYIVQELSGINQKVDLQFLILDQSGERVAEIVETKEILKNDEKEFESIIPIEASVEGDLNLLINLNSETYSTFVQEDIVLGSRVSGFAVFGEAGNTDNYLTGGIVFVFLIFAFFVVRKILKHKLKVRIKGKKI